MFNENQIKPLKVLNLFQISVGILGEKNRSELTWQTDHVVKTVLNSFTKIQIKDFIRPYNIC